MSRDQVADLSAAELEALADILPVPDDDADGELWDRYYAHPVFDEISSRRTQKRPLVSRLRTGQPVIYAVLAGYAHAFDMKRREEAVEIREHAGDPDTDRDLRVEIDPDDAKQTKAFLRRDDESEEDDSDVDSDPASGSNT